MHDYAQNSEQLFWSRKMIEIFIDLYEENRCLYDRSHQDFTNNTVKANVLNNMLQRMREFLPTLELEDIKEKIKIIRAQYCGEIAFSDAAGAEYVPKLWCFDKLKFLREHITWWSTDSDSNNENTIREESQSENNDVYDDSDDSHVYLKTKLEQFKSAPSYKWDPVITKIFIRTLEGYRVLFDEKYNDYKHRISRRKALTKLHKEMQEIDPQINVKHVYDKIIRLRNCYLKELRRLKKKQTNNEKLKSKWWCFEMLGNLFEDRYVTKSNSKLSEEFNENDRHTDNIANAPLHQVEETANNDQYSNIELLEFEEIQQGFDVDQETVFIIETEDNDNPAIIMEYECVNTSMDNTKNVNIQPSTTTKTTTSNCISQELCDNNETDFEVINLTPKKSCSPKAKYTKKSISIRKDLKYESLGNLVVSKMKNISPTHHADFAWDVQCLVRKYILKSKASDGKTSSFVSNNNQDIILSRPSNASFNISFV